MYRAVALAGDRDPATLEIGFDGERVLLDGDDVTAAIRAPEIAQAASRRARDPACAPRCSSASARCCGMATGSPRAATSARSSRPAPSSRSGSRPRCPSARAGAGSAVAEVAERDERDAARAHSPMVAADDAVVLDTTGLSIDEVVARIVGLVGARASG
jgi:cytidylate kinase